MNDGIEVARIDLAPGATVQKHPSLYSTPNWGFPIVYTLVDGRHLDSIDKGFSRKKDAVEAMARFPEVPPRNPTAVELKADGSISMVGVLFSLGRKEEPNVGAGYMSQLLVSFYNTGEIGDEDLTRARDYVALRRAHSEGHRIPNFEPAVADRVEAVILKHR